MTNSEIRTTKNIKLKEEDKMMKLDLYFGEKIVLAP